MAANPGDTSSGMSSEAPPHPTAPTTFTIGVVDTSATQNDYSWQHCIVRISSKAPRHPTVPTTFAFYRCRDVVRQEKAALGSFTLYIRKARHSECPAMRLPLCPPSSPATDIRLQRHDEDCTQQLNTTAGRQGCPPVTTCTLHLSKVNGKQLVSMVDAMAAECVEAL